MSKPISPFPSLGPRDASGGSITANALQLAIVRAVADELERRPLGGRLAESLREQLAEELARLV